MLQPLKAKSASRKVPAGVEERRSGKAERRAGVGERRAGVVAVKLLPARLRSRGEAADRRVKLGRAWPAPPPRGGRASLHLAQAPPPSLPPPPSPSSPSSTSSSLPPLICNPSPTHHTTKVFLVREEEVRKVQRGGKVVKRREETLAEKKERGGEGRLNVMKEKRDEVRKGDREVRREEESEEGRESTLSLLILLCGLVKDIWLERHRRSSMRALASSPLAASRRTSSPHPASPPHRLCGHCLHQLFNQTERREVDMVTFPL